VKLLDFGLAKLRDAEYDYEVGKPTESLQLTDEGVVLGTLPYMAPEQVEGRGADARTDVFALGVVLYEMTTRRAPFRGPQRDSRARLSGGGALREILDDVIAADRRPGSTELAVVRRAQVEFPLGTKIHGPHAFSYVRVELARIWPTNRGDACLERNDADQREISNHAAPASADMQTASAAVAYRPGAVRSRAVCNC
jgi:serine/threonine protein kinase